MIVARWNAKRALQAGINELKIEEEMITLDSYLREGIKF